VSSLAPLRRLAWASSWYSPVHANCLSNITCVRYTFTASRGNRVVGMRVLYTTTRSRSIMLLDSRLLEVTWAASAGSLKQRCGLPPFPAIAYYDSRCIFIIYWEISLSFCKKCAYFAICPKRNIMPWQRCGAKHNRNQIWPFLRGWLYCITRLMAGIRAGASYKQTFRIQWTNKLAGVISQCPFKRSYSRHKVGRYQIMP
jgi:hypothetical protein